MMTPYLVEVNHGADVAHLLADDAEGAVINQYGPYTAEVARGLAEQINASYADPMYNPATAKPWVSESQGYVNPPHMIGAETGE